LHKQTFIGKWTPPRLHSRSRFDAGLAGPAYWLVMASRAMDLQIGSLVECLSIGCRKEVLA
jgi:hypothetical protein